MTLFIDECLPLTSFRTFLQGRGHLVFGVGEAFPSGSPDQSVLAAADARGAVVVTSDRDWRQLLRQVREGERGRFKRAGRILFNCDHSVALRRLEALIEDIEREYELATRSGRQLIMRITEGSYTVER
jgi:predicted nuclease of predicted toxin-antitoxin system